MGVLNSRCDEIPQNWEREGIILWEAEKSDPTFAVREKKSSEPQRRALKSFNPPVAGILIRNKLPMASNSAL